MPTSTATTTATRVTSRTLSRPSTGKAGREAPTQARTVDVQIRAVNNTLVCGKSGGNVRVCAGDTVRWHGGSPFTLECFRLGEEGRREDVASLDGWPFSKSQPPREKWSTPGTEFIGTLKQGTVAYKYSVTMGNLRLDPIIIVDKHR